MSDIEKYLKENMINSRLEYLKKLIGDKTVIIYGSGLLFQTVNKLYDLSKFNITGISDKKFTLEDAGKDFTGYKIIPFIKLAETNADYIIVAIQNYFPVIAELKNFISTSNIIPLVDPDFSKNKSLAKQEFISELFSIRDTAASKIVTIFGRKFIFENETKKLANKYKLLETQLAHNQDLLNKIVRAMSSGINYAVTEHKIEQMTEPGVSDTPREPRLIVSLTSYPERMYDIHYCLYSLLTQSVKPDKLILWLAEEEFPNREKDIPQKVLRLQNFGLTIKWCKNLKSYKKLIPALKEYPRDIIVTADDDVFYPPNWLEKLYNAYLDDIKDNIYIYMPIYANRVHKITFNGEIMKPYADWQKSIDDNSSDFINVAVGCGGILYPPGVLYKDVLDEKTFVQAAPSADDLWFWAMAVLNNTQIKVIKNPINEITYTNPAREFGFSREKTLANSNINGGNDLQLNNIIKKYPEIKAKLRDYHYVFELYNDNIYDYILFLDHKFAYRYVTKYLDSNSSVLEIGCGDGYGTSCLAKHFREVEAIDISKEAVEKAKTIYKLNNCSFKSYPGGKLNYPDKSFDVVVSFHVIEHVNDVNLYLKEIKRVLKDNGTFIITTPSRTYRLAPEQAPWNNEHLREYDSKTLDTTFSEVFKNYKIFSVTAKQEILDIEFTRVAPKRLDFDGKNKNINTNIDYKKEFSAEDFRLSESNLDDGIDLMVTNLEFNSGIYWENRYRSCGNSGAGSFGPLAQFKADIINKFVAEHHIENIIEFGCGDGNQLELFSFKNYTGFDVSDTVLNVCKNKFQNIPQYKFKNISEYNNEKAELTLSLDVIYHLVEDNIYEQYMKQLFGAAEKYVIIYASNKDEEQCIHVKHRKFTEWIEKNKPDWELLEFIPNKHPYSPDKNIISSFADFYIFKKL